ncbi:MAG: hypothetical protein LIO93_00135, partial [Bacteroidales bacterium]|nr:hypothetical protein [Bacteroidales bacterium]
RGIAFIYPLLEKVFIREFFFYNGETEQAFLTHMAKSFPGKEIIYQNNPNAPFLKYKGMIKGLDENIQIVPDIYMGMMLD